MKKFVILVMAISFYVANTYAVGADLVVKTGSNADNVYSKLYAQLNAVCPTNPVLSESFSGGSIQALDSLLGNEANLAFIQSDVVLGRKTIENDSAVDNVRVFMPLYHSELHTIAASTNSSVNRFSDLNQKKVGAYGGAYITARILFGATGVRPFSLTQFASEVELLNAVKAGQVDVGMLVSGQPASFAKSLTSAVYKLVPFDRADILGKLGSYSTASLRYPNLSPVTVPTVAVQIDLFTYNYKSAEKVKNLSKLKACIAAHIDDLRETTGNHPKWNDIDPKAKVSYWPMFQTSK